MTPSLIIHGGAGEIPDHEVNDYINGCRLAAQHGWELLQKGKSALDVVEAVVRILEDDPVYDAGRGSHLTSSGEVEMDAIIMDGATLNMGSVANIKHIRNPISLARLVMEKSPHNMIISEGAEAFALTQGMPLCANEELIVERERQRWIESLAKKFKMDSHGTVGAVARDSNGHIASATSTGGTSNKLPGRVGDSPLIGSGAYCDNHAGGSSATGHGESLMKIVISKSACDLMESGHTAQAAAEAVIKRLKDRVSGTGGVILIDKEGRTGFAFNTPRMARAWVEDGKVIAGC
ncbi:MAG: isoaspartyl peptidase/L-asparaginase [Chloroflexota bacterium]